MRCGEFENAFSNTFLGRAVFALCQIWMQIIAKIENFWTTKFLHGNNKAIEESSYHKSNKGNNEHGIDVPWQDKLIHSHLFAAYNCDTHL